MNDGLGFLGQAGAAVDNVLGSMGQQLSNMVNSLGRAGTAVLVSDVTGQPIQPAGFSLGGGGGTLLLLGLGALFLFGGGKRRW